MGAFSTSQSCHQTALLDLRGNIPTFIHISDGKLHDVNVLDILLPEPGAFYVMDRGYLDFDRLYQLNLALAFFVTRAKSNLQFRRIYSHPVDKSTGLRCKNQQAVRVSDQQLQLTCVNNHRTLSVSLAGGAVLQMDKTTPTHQDFFWHHRERCQDTGLDSCLSLCTCSHHKKTTRYQGQSLLNSTDFKSDYFRNNTNKSVTYRM